MALQAIVILAVSWMGFILTDTREKVVRLEERVSDMRSSVTSGSNDRYRNSDASRDFNIRDQEIQRLERRIEAMEKRK